jgi:HK97 family phage prohead protease
MSAADKAAERMAGLETDALGKLNDSLDGAYKSLVPEDLRASTDAIRDAIYGTFSAFLPAVREDAARHFSDLAGEDVAPSGTDDTERATKASDYCAEAWLSAMQSDYGKALQTRTLDEWEAAIAIARKAVDPALRNAASFEVAKAWNNEHRRAVLARPGLGYAFTWYARSDGLICQRCLSMDGKVSDASGDFSPEGWPPLHGRCRCIVMPEKVTPEKALSEGTMTYEYSTKDAGSTLVSKALHVKRVDAERRTADFIASTSDVDRDGDVLEQDWDLDAFKANPVCLFAHDSDDLPIGKAVDVAVRNGQLECTIQFSTADLNPLAEQVWRNVREGVLRAVSVGFMPGDIRWEMRDGQDVYVHSRNKLYEISVVPIPCNQHALAKMKSKAFDAAKAARTEPEQSAPTNNTDAVEKAATESTHMSELLQKAIDDAKAETKSLTEKAAALEVRAVEAETKAAALATDKAALEAQTKALADARDAATARALEAEGKLIDLEVDALVGKTITPAEKPLFVDLRKANPELFAKMVEQRAPLNLTVPVIAGKDEEQGTAKSLGGDAGAEFLAKLAEQG